MSKGRNKGVSPKGWARTGAFRGKLNAASKISVHQPSKKRGTKKEGK